MRGEYKHLVWKLINHDGMDPEDAKKRVKELRKELNAQSHAKAGRKKKAPDFQEEFQELKKKGKRDFHRK